MKNSHHYRFFVSPDSISGNNFFSREKELINQAKNVFRLRSGDKIVVLDNSGMEYDVQISNISKDSIIGNIVRKTNNNTKNKGITLFIPLIRNNNFELVLEKCTEFGVSAFQPVFYKHSVVKLGVKKERWAKIIKEASEQCGRFVMPEIKEPISFTDAIKKLEGRSCFVADEGAVERMKNEECRIQNEKQINLFVGPEGGFGAKEIEAMRKKGFNFFNPGEDILRSETACILSVGFFFYLVLK